MLYKDKKALLEQTVATGPFTFEISVMEHLKLDIINTNQCKLSYYSAVVVCMKER